MVLFRRDSEGGPAPLLLRMSPLRTSGREPPGPPLAPPPAPLGMPPAAWATRDPDLRDKTNEPTEEEQEAEEEMIALRALFEYEEELRGAEEKKSEEEREAEEEMEAVGELIKYEKALKIAEESKTTENLKLSAEYIKSCPSNKLSCDSAGDRESKDETLGNTSSADTTFMSVDRGIQVNRTINTSCPHCGHDLQEDPIPRKSLGTQTDNLVVGEGVTTQSIQKRNKRGGSQDSDETFYEPAERDKAASEGIQRVAAWQVAQSSDDETFYEPVERGRMRTVDGSNIYVDETIYTPPERGVWGAEGERNVYSDKTMCRSVETELLFEEGPKSIFSDATVCMSDETVLVDNEGEKSIYMDETICASADTELILKEEKNDIFFLGGICYTSSQKELRDEEDEKTIYLDETSYTPGWVDWKPAEGARWECEKENTEPAENLFEPPEKKRSKTEIGLVRDAWQAGPSGVGKTSPAEIGGRKILQSPGEAGWIACKTGPLKLKFMREAKKRRNVDEEIRNIPRSPSPGHICALPRCELHQPFYVSSNRELMSLPKNVRPMARRRGGQSPKGFWSLDMPSSKSHN